MFFGISMFAAVRRNGSTVPSELHRANQCGLTAGSIMRACCGSMASIPLLRRRDKSGLEEVIFGRVINRPLVGSGGDVQCVSGSDLHSRADSSVTA